MIYLTYNDQPSGIYNSQVIDVVKYLNSIQSSEKVKLVALISIRSFFKNRKLIKLRLPQSIVLPMVPKAALWRWNYLGLLFLFLFTKKQTIMARGPFATCLAIWLKKSGRATKVIFDGRGAYKAELNEYDVVKNETIKKQIAEIEKQVVLNSDFRLAISNALVNYWKKEFGYASDKHIVVPCTLSNDFSFEFPSKEKLSDIKKEIGFSEDDIVLVYSGSTAGWQSFTLVEGLLSKLMTAAISLEAVNQEQELTVSREDVAVEGAAGVLRAGEHMPASALLWPLLLSSSNDAAYTLARPARNDCLGSGTPPNSAIGAIPITGTTGDADGLS